MTPAAEQAAVVAIDLAVLRQSVRFRTALGLSAAEWRVFLAVMTAAVHQYLNAPQPDPRFLDGRPLPPNLAGRTSCRRVADVTGLPPETVRRITARLIEGGHLRRDAHGLHSASGTYVRFAADGTLNAGMQALAVACGADRAAATARMRMEPRITAYRLSNIGLQLQLSLARQYDLAPAPLDLFLSLLLQPPAARSRRDAARLVGLPHETLRRHVVRLTDRGLLVPGPGIPCVPQDVRARHPSHPEAAERLRLAARLRLALAVPGDAAQAA